MSVLDSISRGVDSATYNPEAERAAAARDAAASTAKAAFKKLLDQVKQEMDTLVTNKQMTSISLAKFDELIKTNTELITTIATGAVWDQRTQLLKDTEADLTAFNKALYNLEYIARTGPIILDDIDKKEKGKVTTDTMKSMKAFFVELDTYNKASVTKKTIDLQQKLLKTKADITNNIPPPYANRIMDPSNEKLVNEAKVVHEASQKQKDEEFNVTRLATTSSNIAIQVVSSLLYVTFCLVAGMLCANDAIGREIPYRVLYFIYGFIFAPVVLIYYLYKWYNDDAPKIYRLLPIYTTVSDNTLGQYFFYPFTYKEDKMAMDAYADFMKASAKLVGGSAEAKASAEAAASATAGKLMNGVKSLHLGTATAATATATAATATAATNKIMNAMEGLRVNK